MRAPAVLQYCSMNCPDCRSFPCRSDSYYLRFRPEDVGLTVQYLGYSNQVIEHLGLGVIRGREEIGRKCHNIFVTWYNSGYTLRYNLGATKLNPFLKIKCRQSNVSNVEIIDDDDDYVYDDEIIKVATKPIEEEEQYRTLDEEEEEEPLVILSDPTAVILDADSDGEDVVDVACVNCKSLRCRSGKIYTEFRSGLKYFQ